jgi:hypothetical protein
MSALKFRNITASVDDPVETWPFEGIFAAVERGTLPDWRRLAAAIRADPRGPVAQQVLEAVEMSRPYGTSELLTAVIRIATERPLAETVATPSLADSGAFPTTARVPQALRLPGSPRRRWRWSRSQRLASGLPGPRSTSG